MVTVTAAWSQAPVGPAEKIANSDRYEFFVYPKSRSDYPDVAGSVSVIVLVNYLDAANTTVKSQTMRMAYHCSTGNPKQYSKLSESRFSERDAKGSTLKSDSYESVARENIKPSTVFERIFDYACSVRSAAAPVQPATGVASPQPLEPLFGGFYSSDCSSVDSTVSTFMRTNSIGANYTYVGYNKRQEVIREAGFARPKTDRSALVLVGRHSYSDSNGGVAYGHTHWMIRPESTKYAILYLADNGKLSIEDGRSIYSLEENERFKCSSDSAAVRGAIGSLDRSQITKKLPAPAVLDEGERQKIETQTVSFNAPWRRTNELNRSLQTLMAGKTDLEKFYVSSKGCELMKAIVISAEAAAKIDPAINDSVADFVEGRDAVCEPVDSAPAKFEKLLAAAKKDPKLIETLDCLDAKAPEQMKAGGWSQVQINRIITVSKEACVLKNSRQSQTNVAATSLLNLLERGILPLTNKDNRADTQNHIPKISLIDLMVDTPQYANRSVEILCNLNSTGASVYCDSDNKSINVDNKTMNRGHYRAALEKCSGTDCSVCLKGILKERNSGLVIENAFVTPALMYACWRERIFE